MQISDKARFRELLEAIMAYYKQDTSEFMLSIWWEACKGFDIEQISKALTGHATDPDCGQFPPKVADIIKQLAGTTTDRAAMAWGKVYEAMQRIGAYTDVVFDDPAIHASIRDLGGWSKVCRTESAEISYLQHKFCESHKAYTKRGKFEYPRFLIGDRSSDDEYLRVGQKIPTPKPIGDLERARLVYKGVELLELK